MFKCSPGFHQLFTRHHNRRSTFVPCSEHCTSAAYELISGYCSKLKDLSSVSSAHDIVFGFQSSCTSAVHPWQRCRMSLATALPHRSLTAQSILDSVATWILRIDLILRYQSQSGSLPSCQQRSGILPSHVSRSPPTHRLESVMFCHG